MFYTGNDPPQIINLWNKIKVIKVGKDLHGK